MLWGCFCWYGPGYLSKIEGTMDAGLYIEILKDELEKTFGYYGYTKDTVTFQHDNDPKHTSRKVKTYLNDCEIDVMSWPSFSPDLNPIENLWAILKRRLAAYSTAPGSIKELFIRVTDVWNEIELDTCKKLIESMHNRCLVVIDANGDQIDY